MKLSGQVRKMNVEFGNPIQYFLNLDKESHPLNSNVGSNLKISWQGLITCVECGRKTKSPMTKAIALFVRVTYLKMKFVRFAQSFVTIKMEMKQRKSFGEIIAMLTILSIFL